MSLQGDADKPQQLIIVLEIVPEDIYDADSALVNAVKRDATDALLDDSYVIHSPTVAYRGGGSIVEIITTFTTIATNAWAYKGIAEEVLNDLSALITIFSSAIPIAMRVLQAHEKHVDKEERSQQPVKLTIDIDGATIAVEAADLEQTEAAIKLAQEFRAKHTFVATKATAQSRVKIKDRIPKKKPHRKR